ncbi:MAG: hypothetical protein K2Y18_03580 [Alphaproteobacteria bacterium]|jgi:hypothetical protein|nr:hypothetical protein [Alphaproteobacteria bacterium]
MNKNNQDQKSGDNSVNVQAGTLIVEAGLTYQDVKDIARDLFSENFLVLQKEAKETASQRAQEVVECFLNKLQETNPLPLESLKSPDMQISLFNAQKGYAQIGKRELADLLVDILVRRKQAVEELQKIVLSESILVAPLLLQRQLNAISVRFVLSYSMQGNILNIESFRDYFKEYLLPFCSELATEASDYQHIDYTKCGSISISGSNLFDILKKNYPAVFTKGFDKSSIETIALNPDQEHKLFIPCLRDPSKFQVSALNSDVIDMLGKKYDIDESKISQLKALQNTNSMLENEIEDDINQIDPNFKNLFKTWKTSSLQSLQLTSVGIALAQANIKRITGIDLDLGIWIK